VFKIDKKCIKVTKNENMIKVVVIDRNDNRHELDAPTDMNMNMMELCRSYELPVEGTCGGMAMCASCHMYVLSSHETGDRSNDEEDMLDEAFFVEDNSRLGCQIKLRDSLDGIEIKLAPVG
jgi:2Fe-2S ferredoxin